MTDQLLAEPSLALQELPVLTQAEIDQRVFDLYDEHCHGRIDHREFLARSAAVTIGGLAMAQALLPRYVQAQTISVTDPRIKGELLVIHENRELNPYLEDAARRAATEGFLALAPDGLTPVGGYPGDDDGRTLQAGLDQRKLRTDMVNSARYLKGHTLSTGKLGVTGFCWGGSKTNFLAATLGPDMHAGVPFYGAARATESVKNIRAALLIQYAENDPGVNGTRAGYEAALKAAGVQYEMRTYPGTQHGFHNNSTPRYHEASAKLAWERTIAFFKKHLA